jgi:tetratricopeptide (TPR) repeat protein
MLEKVPLVLLAAIFCGVTLRTQSDAIAMSANEAIPLVWRIANALVSYVAYLEQAVFPAGMAVFYPHLEDQLPMQRVFLALAVLVLISAAAVVCRRRCPYVLMGWLWYLVMLVPVSGVVQTGWHARGDRFTYLPQIGLCMALVWGARDLCRSSWSRRWAGGLTAALVLAVLMGCAWRQTSFWCDSETLWTHALACTEPHELPHGKLGLALAERGQFEAAIAEYQKALEIKSANFEIRNNLSVALMALGRFDEAIPQSQEALRLAPGTAEAHFNLAFMLGRRSRFDEAVAHYRQGLEIAPGDAKAHFYLGKALAHGRRFGEAIAQFEQAVQLNPEDVDARLNLAWLRATCGAASLRDGAAAIEHAQRAMQLCGGQRADVFDALAAGYAEAGRFAEAIVAARRALELAAELKVPVLTNAARARLALYEAGHPLHQGSSAAPRSP